jgi:hypothetical protein
LRGSGGGSSKKCRSPSTYREMKIFSYLRIGKTPYPQDVPPKAGLISSAYTIEFI